MNQLTIGKLLFATFVTAASAAVGHAQGVQAAQLLSGGSSCLHVIRLIQMHGVNNSFDTSGMQMASQSSPFGDFSGPNTEMGDLEIVQVAQEPNVDPGCGPKFIVSIHNNSCRDVCSFHVTVVATLGRIFPHSPNSTACVDKICAGATVDVCVQLPLECLAMGNQNGQVIGFQKLVVAIDAFDELAETNEANNLRALACSEIPIVAVVEEQAVATVDAEEIDVTTTVEPQANLAQPNSADIAAPDQVDQEVPVDALRSAIRMLDTPTQESTAAIGAP